MDFKEDLKFERKIQQMLEEIEEKDIRTLETINNDTVMVVNDLFRKYRHYPKNTEDKKKEFIERIKSGKYEWISSIDELKKGDVLYILDGSDFFNIKLRFIKKFYSYCPQRNIIFSKNQYYKHIQYNKKMKFFRKLTKKELFKVMLVETLFEIDDQ